jgi:hypothetical protein
MRSCLALIIVSAIGLAGLGGCANARYVQVDQACGVVAMPANTNSWPFYYRDHAEALIRQKCPNGYDVVHEGEAVTGQVAHTDAQTETRGPPTLNLGGADHDKKSSAFAGVAIPLGETEQRTHETTHVEDVTEWRISYRAK